MQSIDVRLEQTPLILCVNLHNVHGSVNCTTMLFVVCCCLPGTKLYNNVVCCVLLPAVH